MNASIAPPAPGAGSSDGRPTPKDELAYIQTIITEHEKHAFTVMALLAAVLTGLGTMALSWKTNLTPDDIRWTIGCPAVGAFGIWALSHRAIPGKAIARVRTLEKIIKDGSKYEGPWISHELQWVILDVRNWAKCFFHHTFFIPIGIALAAVFTLANVVERNQATASVSDSLTSTAIDAARTHVGFGTTVNAEGDKATVTTSLLPQQCTFQLAKTGNKEKPWVVSKVECKELDKPLPSLAASHEIMTPFPPIKESRAQRQPKHGAKQSR